MLNAIEKAVECVRKAARDQSERIVSELLADFDARNNALTVYNDLLRQARALREEADSMEREAHDAFNSALTSSGSIALSLVNQINQGQIVTSTDVPASKRLDRSKPAVLEDETEVAPE